MHIAFHDYDTIFYASDLYWSINQSIILLTVQKYYYSYFYIPTRTSRHCSLFFVAIVLLHGLVAALLASEGCKLTVVLLIHFATTFRFQEIPRRYFKLLILSPLLILFVMLIGQKFLHYWKFFTDTHLFIYHSTNRSTNSITKLIFSRFCSYR